MVRTFKRSKTDKTMLDDETHCQEGASFGGVFLYIDYSQEGAND